MQAAASPERDHTSSMERTASGRRQRRHKKRHHRRTQPHHEPVVPHKQVSTTAEDLDAVSWWCLPLIRTLVGQWH